MPLTCRLLDCPALGTLDHDPVPPHALVGFVAGRQRKTDEVPSDSTYDPTAAPCVLSG